MTSFSPAYDDEEPEYDENEPIDPAENEHENVNDNEPNLIDQVGRDVVDIGKESVAAGGRGKASDMNKNKKIAKEDRKTTPYMTKYERARVLGTRALQIRYVGQRKPLAQDLHF